MNGSYDNARFQLHPQKKFTNEFVVRFFGDARNDQAVVDVMEEFRRNGRDVDLPEEATMLKCVKEPQASRTQSFSRMCVFCKANGETPVFYGGHSLKDELGRVVCPVLVRYVCPLCGATGDRAHTVKYCPLKPVQGHYNAGTKTWERNAIGKVVPAKKFLPISK